MPASVPAIEFASQSPASVQADAVVVFATREGDAAALTRDALAVGHTLGIDLADELSAIRFDGSLAAIARLPTRGRAAAPVLLVVGVGQPEEVTSETLRRAAGAVVRTAAKNSTLAVVVPGDLPEQTDTSAAAQAVTEGAGLGAYAFTAYRTKAHDMPSLERILVVAGEGVDHREVRDAVASAQITVRATALARDLVNEPPAEKRPPDLAERIRAIAKDAGVKAKIWDEQALAKGGFGGILGVGQGSSAPPRLVELTYEPGRSRGHVVLVGKGITFDSGGLSLKSSDQMTWMKADMAGGAAVVAAMSVLGDLGVRTKVTGLVALAENMPSGTAIRVSDVLTHRGGKTVEVMNTDAEGRLVLADALAYGTELEPDVMIDLATLTGAQIIALGMRVGGLLATDEALAGALEAAATEVGEQLWRLPLPPEYADQLRSEVADLRNIGKPREAGTIIGGLFLKEFAGDVPWAHLDIAGPAFTEEGDSWYTPKGGTGAGVRTLLRYLAARG